MKTIVLASSLMTICLLSACDEPTPTPNFDEMMKYSDLCIEDPEASQCKTREVTKAKEKHRETAPKYRDTNDCESIHGRCEAVRQADGSSIFMPMMLGFMAGYMVNGMMQPSNPYYYTNQAEHDRRYADRAPQTTTPAPASGQPKSTAPLTSPTAKPSPGPAPRAVTPSPAPSRPSTPSYSAPSRSYSAPSSPSRGR